MSTSVNNLVDTMKHLGDTTSRNLDFSYRPNVPVSYGEETITESNLLELRRRHSDVIHLRTFSKIQESKNGADWEWYIIGMVRHLAMRVQAKRVQRNNVLRIRHTVGQTGKQQHKLLIDKAKADGMKPMYCIYCTERQRRHWTQIGGLETGCLFTDAGNLSEYTCSLSLIESACWPWHLLFDPDFVKLNRVDAKTRHSSPRSLVWDGPSIRDLNEETDWDFNPAGVRDNSKFDLRKLTADSDGRLMTGYKVPRLTVASDKPLATETESAQPIDNGVKGTVVIDLRSLES